MLYDLIMACLMQNIALRWNVLLSYCLDDDAVVDAVNMCEFYGVAIHGHPSGHIRAKWLQTHCNLART